MLITAFTSSALNWLSSFPCTQLLLHAMASLALYTCGCQCKTLRTRVSFDLYLRITSKLIPFIWMRQGLVYPSKNTSNDMYYKEHRIYRHEDTCNASTRVRSQPSSQPRFRRRRTGSPPRRMDPRRVKPYMVNIYHHSIS